MAYVYICQPCRNGNHDQCEQAVGFGFGVGHCLCSHGKPEDRDPFERATWEATERMTR